MFESQNRQNPRKLANRVANWKKFGIISDEQMPAEGGQPGAGQNQEQVIRQQAALADEENQKAAAGEPIEVHPTDVHEVHLEIHGAFPQQNNIISAHIAEHQAMQGGGQVGGQAPSLPMGG
mgnify:FL=1